MSNLEKLLPDRWQTPKELVRIGANLFGALFAAQAIGVDPTKFGLSPALGLWESGAVFLAFLAALTWISNHQEAQKG